MVLVVGIGITTFGVFCTSAISLSYTVDCFKEIPGESFVAIMIVRNNLGFSFSYAITPWIEATGLRNCFISVSMISLVCTGSFHFMIRWGKSLRRQSAGKYWEFVAAERDTAINYLESVNRCNLTLQIDTSKIISSICIASPLIDSS